jgi:hypothetical protein
VTLQAPTRQQIWRDRGDSKSRNSNLSPIATSLHRCRKEQCKLLVFIGDYLRSSAARWISWFFGALIRNSLYGKIAKTTKFLKAKNGTLRDQPFRAKAGLRPRTFQINRS